jgi:phosphate transport system substrate-binding protein
MQKFFAAAISATVAFSMPVLAAERVLIQNKGSDTLVNVAQAWAEAYSEVNSAAAVAVSGGGTGTGIAAMINGTVDIANASREMTDKEIAEAQKGGQQPVKHVVGFDALAVFLHRDNPINTLSMDQLAQIFGREGKATKWSDLGVKVPGCNSDSIVVVSRQNNSGTYAYFREAVLKTAAEKGTLHKGSYRLGTLDMHGSKDVVDLVEKTPCAIGYSGLAYANPGVKMACIAATEGSACVPPNEKTAADKSYPIARPLFMYTNGAPKGTVKEYLDWILGDKGQCIIYHKGYAPAHQVTCH